MTGWPEGLGRRVLAETDSTMAEATRRAKAGVLGPEWTMALHQTAGRGRRGRAWSMPSGNFAASLLMRPKGSPSDVALRSFVAALALRDTFRGVGVPQDRIALKWPNDVLVDGGKIAGILLESESDGRGGVAHLIVGIGVNLAVAPAPTELETDALRPTDLQQAAGIQIGPEAFLDRLAPNLERYEIQFATYGFAPIRAAWLSSAARLGETITARLPGAEVTGIFSDVDVDGNLVLQTGNTRRTIAAAEIFF